MNLQPKKTAPAVRSILKPGGALARRAVWLAPALMLGLAATNASAQVPEDLRCVAGDPFFLAEGPVSAITNEGGGVYSITSMGVTYWVPEGTPVSTPTNDDLGMAGFADPTPFPNRV